MLETGSVDPKADVMRDLARLHYDLAGFPLPRQLSALLAITATEHRHYGRGYPFTPEAAVKIVVSRLDKDGPPAAAPTENTRRLFPPL
jgi:6-methylsalicylate decarboxylase